MAPIFGVMREKVLMAIEVRLQKEEGEAKERLASLQDALGAESKSSAGDKHETGRAMIHREMELVEETRARTQTAQETLKKIQAASLPLSGMHMGALVETTGPWVFVGIPMGKLQLGEDVVLCVGPSAPIVKVWGGIEEGDEVSLGPNRLTILGHH